MNSVIRSLPRIQLILCLLLLTGVGLHAQENDTGSSIALGTLVEGRLDDETPRRVYFFEGSRGEVLRLRLNATSGNLDPVLNVFDNVGNVVLAQDDQDGGQDVDTTLRLRADGRYYVVLARFGYALGSTSGAYEFSLERVGIVSQQGSTLRYGYPVANTITNTQPQLFYTFRAEAGDILNIEMQRTSGTLDPYLQVVAGDRFLLAENDDAPGDNPRDARVQNLLIEATGTYIVIASRYGEASGDTVGGFILSVTESGNSGLGNNRLAPAPLLNNQAATGRIDNDSYESYYSFEGQRDEVVTLIMEQTSGQLDAYLILATSGYEPLIEDDDSGSGRNARIGNYRLPGNGRYVVIATRFERAEGVSFGEYELRLERNGNAFADVNPGIPRLQYNTNARGTLDDTLPQEIHAFWGNRGDVISVRMNRASGTLDPVLELLDRQRRRILRDDSNGSGENAFIQDYRLDYTGVHYILASRYDGTAKRNDTQGEYNLILLQEAARTP